MHTYLFLPCVLTFCTLKDGKAIDKLKTLLKQHSWLTVYNFNIFGYLETIVNCLQTCLEANQTTERPRVLKRLNNLFAGNTQWLWRPTTSNYLGLPLEFCKFFLGDAMKIFPLVFLPWLFRPLLPLGLFLPIAFVSFCWSQHLLIWIGLSRDFFWHYRWWLHLINW